MNDLMTHSLILNMFHYWMNQYFFNESHTHKVNELDLWQHPSGELWTISSL